MSQNNKTQKLLNRETLKELFNDGMRPTGASFANLIYSTVNKLDDGIEKNFDNGLSLSPQGNDAESLLSLFHQIDDANPAWILGLTSKEEGGGLNFKEGQTGKSKLYLEPNGRIGIHTTSPQYELDIEGTVGMKSRKGTYAHGKVPANGKWQTILDNETDCTLFELVICARGGKGKGKYAVMHALAFNPYAGKRGSIKKHQSFYGWRWWYRLKIRWVGTPFNYQLQVRTVSNYGADAKIEFHTTRLI